MLKIPKKFNILGRTIKVELVDSLEKHNCVGRVIYNDNSIQIGKGDVSCKFSKDTIMEIFYHELLHWIFWMIDEEELNNNEKLINQMAGVLYQVHNTMEYKK